MTTATAPAHSPRLIRPWAVLWIVLVAEIMDLVDGTIVNVAAPSIRADLGGSAATLQWLAAAYTLAFAVLLITGGRLGDLFGRRRMFIVGIAGFTIASTLCAFAPSPAALITARVAQGAFGALLIPQGFGMLKDVFAEDELTKAFAFFGPVMGLSAIVSPILGGVLTDGLGWRAIFLVNVPLGIVGLIGALRVMPDVPGNPETRLDPVGAVLATLASFAVIYPLVQGRELGWPAWIFALMAAGLAGFAAFAAWERRHRERALIEPSLLRNRAFTSGLVVAVCFFACMIGLNLVLSLFCQLGEGFSPLRTGLTLAPFALGVGLGAPASYPLAQRFGRRAMQGGFVVMGAGILLLALMVNGAGAVTSWTLVPGEIVAGLGMGIALPPLFDFILAGVEPHEVGSASGVLNAIQQFGGALGLALLATIFFSYVDDHHTAATAMTRTALLSVIPLGLAFLAVFRLPYRAREQS
nr:tetracycline resistance MFS efflux pump [uncultured bacterium]